MLPETTRARPFQRGVLIKKIIKLRRLEVFKIKSLEFFLFDQGIGLLRDIVIHPGETELNIDRLQLAHDSIELTFSDPKMVSQLKKSRSQKIDEPSPDYILCCNLPGIVLDLNEKFNQPDQENFILINFKEILNNLAKISLSKQGLAYQLAEKLIMDIYRVDKKNNLNLELMEQFMNFCYGSQVLENITT